VLAGYVVFSFSSGTFHSYYTSAIAPGVAALAATSAVVLADRVRRSLPAAGLLAVAVAGTAILSFVILGRSPGFVPWLRWVVLGAGALVAVTLIGLRLVPVLRHRWVGLIVIGAAAVSLLAGPAAYSLATVGHGQTGSNPTAGPVGSFGRPRAGAQSDQTNPALVRYLERHRDGARYIVAATGSQTAAQVALATNASVITMGGFMGADPAPTVAQLASLVRSGQLQFVLLGGGGGHSSGVSAARTQWVQMHCQPVSPARLRTSASSSGGAPGGARASGSALYRCTPANAG
jgi:4-amino-4-deoxy-L-arabinose transferase-like glycosyltransferase